MKKPEAEYLIITILEESSEIIVVYVVPDTVKNEGSIVDLKFKLKKRLYGEAPNRNEAG